MLILPLESVACKRFEEPHLADGPSRVLKQAGLLTRPNPGDYFTRPPGVCQDSLFAQGRAFPQARPQRVKIRGVPSGAHGATNKSHQVCARRRVVRRPGPR